MTEPPFWWKLATIMHLMVTCGAMYLMLSGEIKNLSMLDLRGIVLTLMLLSLIINLPFVIGVLQ